MYWARQARCLAVAPPILENLIAIYIPISFWRFLTFSLSYTVAVMRAKLLQSCSTLCDPMDCSPPGFSVHGILQARILEWVAMLSSRGSSWPRDQTCISFVSCTGRQVLYHSHHLRGPSLSQILIVEVNPQISLIYLRGDFVQTQSLPWRGLVDHDWLTQSKPLLECTNWNL